MSNLKTIDTIPTLELIDELVKRCSPCVFIGVKNEGVADKDVSYWEFKGDPGYCIGLCHKVAWEIEKDEIRKLIKGEDAE